ncbi:MAG: hypothetical protein GY716_16540 [bacterium]|nr:hypothetical protein [bacterium]
MKQPVRSSWKTAVLLVVLVLFGSSAHAATVIGEWTLVEQTYGEGKSNLVDEDAAPLRLEFFRQGHEVHGKLRVGAGDESVHSWPRLVADSSRGVDIEERRVSAGEDRIVTRYRVDPSPGDDLFLEVTEDYQVVEGGAALIGTVRVRFERHGKDKGSYVLHRRLERTDR